MRSKKILALTCAVTMLCSSTTVFASPITSGDITGSGVIEFDNSTAPTYDNVVLPTISASTYNFTLDPNSLLAGYSANRYDAGKSLYYLSEDDAATAVPKNVSNTLYHLSKSADATATVATLQTALTCTDGAALILNASFKEYLWVPSAAKASTGSFVQLTAATIPTYFNYTIVDNGDSTYTVSGVAFKDKVSTDSCDGKFYKDVYTTVTDAGAYTCLTFDSNDAVTAVDDLYLSSDATTYTAVTAASSATDLTITPATDLYQNKSDAVNITNKSTNDLLITATITATNTTGLTFVNGATFSDNTASLNMGIVSASNTTANGSEHTDYLTTTDDTTSADVSFKLNGVDQSTATTYQGISTDVSTTTGGHNYYQYSAPNPSYNSASFYMTGACNSFTTADLSSATPATKTAATEKKAAWEAYEASVTAATRPSITVVYKIEKTSDVTSTITADADGYVTALTAADQAPSITADTVNFTKGSGGSITVDLGKAGLAATDIASVATVVSGTEYPWTDGYSLSGTTLSLTSAAPIASLAIADTRTIRVKFDDTAGTTKDLTLTMIANPDAPSIATTAIDYSKASGGTATVNLGGNGFAATGITSVSTVVSGTEYPWTGGYSLSGTTLSLTTAAPINAVAAGQTRTVRVKFNDSLATTVDLTLTIQN